MSTPTPRRYVKDKDELEVMWMHAFRNYWNDRAREQRAIDAMIQAGEIQREREHAAKAKTTLRDFRHESVHYVGDGTGG